MPSGLYTIAVVEDDSSLAKALVRLLRAAGYMAFSCASAEEFLADPRSRGANFLAIDVHLPGMSGINLQEKLLESQPARPVAFMTALDEAGIRERAERAGCVAFLHKPFESEELLGAIRGALNSALIVKRPAAAEKIPHDRLGIRAPQRNRNKPPRETDENGNPNTTLAQGINRGRPRHACPRHRARHRRRSLGHRHRHPAQAG